ncbi:MAG: TerC family protein [Planctomycetota bacterium]
MLELITFENLGNLLMLCFLQAVLGFDNLLYISIESKRAPEADRARVRRLGIGLAIVLRIVLLVLIYFSFEKLQHVELFGFETSVMSAHFHLPDLVTLLGGAFIIYTATKEVMHMIALEEVDSAPQAPANAKKVITMIVIMNLVFSFDSILSAMALTDNLPIMAIAIVISGILMIVMADQVSTFLAKNRMYEVLGLFVLFVVGVMLVTEAGEHAQITLFGTEVTKMSKTTFYFVIAVLALTDIVQTRYQKKLLAKKRAADAQAAG